MPVTADGAWRTSEPGPKRTAAGQAASVRNAISAEVDATDCRYGRRVSVAAPAVVATTIASQTPSARGRFKRAIHAPGASGAETAHTHRTFPPEHPDGPFTWGGRGREGLVGRSVPVCRARAARG